MNRFHSGTKRGGFSELLRQAKRGQISHGQDNSQSGAKPYPPGSAQRVPGSDKATLRHMDAKDNAGHQPAGTRISHGARKAQKLGDSASHRIARGDPGFHPREMHHKTQVERAGGVPAHQSVINRSGPGRKGGTTKKFGSSGMSPELKSRPGVPGHQSVINRGKVPRGGYKHSRTRKMNLASKIMY